MWLRPTKQAASTGLLESASPCSSSPSRFAFLELTQNALSVVEIGLASTSILSLPIRLAEHALRESYMCKAAAYLHHD
jgi:hypothetical protein